MATTRTYAARDAMNTGSDPIMSVPQPKMSYKRKRDSPDRNGNKNRSNQRHSSSLNETRPNGHEMNETSQGAYHYSENPTAYGLHQQIAQHLAAESSQAATNMAPSIPRMTVPQPTELSFPSSGTGGETDRPMDSSFDMGAGSDGDHNQPIQGGQYGGDSIYAGNSNQQTQSADHGSGPKPAVGTEEWHKVRRDNHKEVERRRRETINEGINELAKIVPNCEKNKGSILQRGVQYITQLRENERINIEKWTLDKMVTEQAIAELSAANERGKEELAQAQRELERWKRACIEANIEPKDLSSITAGSGDA